MLFGGKDVLYGKNLTAALTDLAGTFLVFCFAIYFTVGGYCLYRELAING